MFKGSWQTSAAGLGAIFAAIGDALTKMFDGDPATNPDWAVLIAAIMAGVGLLKARDNGVTSEDAKAAKQ